MVKEVACEVTSAIWGDQEGGREENKVLWDTNWPFIVTLTFYIILWERFVQFILNKLFAELLRDLFAINTRRRNTWTEVWTSMPLGLVVNLSSFVRNSNLLIYQAREKSEEQLTTYSKTIIYKIQK